MSKLSLMVQYLYDHLQENTFWCEDMMPMLVYLADKFSKQERNESMSGIFWIVDNKKKSLQGFYEPWRTLLDPENSFWAKIRRRSKGYGLSKEELKILQKVVGIKKSDQYRVGSLQFREFLFQESNFPLDKVKRKPDRMNHQTDLLWQKRS